MVKTSTTGFRWPAVSAGVALIALEVFTLLGSLLLTLMRCDESCTDDPGRPWRNTVGAWQWDAFPILNGLALLAAIGGVAFAVRGRARDSHVAYALSVGAMLVWIAIYASA
jgi:hypothetical protein